MNPDLFAPRYLLRVEGTRLSEDVTRYVTAVEFTEAENQAAAISLTVLSDNGRFLDSKIFAEGNSVDLWIGYAGHPLRFMGRGAIVRPEVNFPRAGIPTLRVVAHDAARKLMKSPKKDKGRTWRGKTDSEIAEEVFSTAGISAFTFETKGTPRRTRKRGQSAWDFLVRLARLNNFIVSSGWDAKRKLQVGYFGPAADPAQTAQHVLSYGTGELDATLLEFRTFSSTAGQRTQVVVSYVDPKTKKSHSVSVDVGSARAEAAKFVGPSGAKKLKKEISAGAKVTVTAFGHAEEVIPGRPFHSVADARKFAAAWYAAREAEFVLARGVAVGSSDLRLGQTHKFRGLGCRLSGEWQLTSVTHSISGGAYETRFSARKIPKDSAVTPGDTSAARGEEVDA